MDQFTKDELTTIVGALLRDAESAEVRGHFSTARRACEIAAKAAEMTGDPMQQRTGEVIKLVGLRYAAACG